MPRVGAPPVVTGLPCLSMNWAYPLTPPSATSLPGTDWTSASTDSGKGARWPWPKVSLVRTATSVPLVVCSNRSLKVLLMVSVSTKVPATKPTPRTIASAVSASRSLCEVKPRTRTFHIGDQSPSRFIRSSTLSAVGSSISSTRWPSARKSTRSA